MSHHAHVGMSKYDGEAHGKHKGHGSDSWEFHVVDDPKKLPKAPFNVLYVETPRIGLFQTPEWRGLTNTWKEAMDMIKPLGRWGLPEAELEHKSPLHHERCAWRPILGAMFLRLLLCARQSPGPTCPACASHLHEHAYTTHAAPLETDPHPSPCSKHLVGTPAGAVLMGSKLRKVSDGIANGWIFEHPHKHVPHSHPPLHEVPPTLVLASNLLCYWLITREGNRSR